MERGVGSGKTVAWWRTKIDPCGEIGKPPTLISKPLINHSSMVRERSKIRISEQAIRGSVAPRALRWKL